MGFFDVPPYTPAPFRQAAEPSWPVWLKPEVVLPGVAVGERLLAYTEEVAVRLGSMWGYPNGFEVELSLRVPRVEPDRQWLDPDLLRLYHRARLVGEQPPPLAPGELLRFGVRYADGRVAINTDARPLPSPEVEPGHPILWTVQAAGGGPMRRLDLTYWIWPLPPPGPLTFVCEWPIYGIPETQVAIDAGPLLKAAGRSVTLWPEEPGEHELSFRLMS